MKAPKPMGKHKVLPNGRNKKPMPSFEQWHCRIFPKDVTYPAWKSLSKTATDVANICRAKHDRAAAMGSKNGTGAPIFDFTFSEAETFFKMTRPTFSEAIKKLILIEFMRVERPGGICNGVGISTHYTLTDGWKTWTPPEKDNTNMIKARSVKNRIPVKEP